MMSLSTMPRLARIVLPLALGVVVGLGAASWSPAFADVASTGSLTATRTCPAFQSIRKSTNPGNVELVVGHSYDVLSQNARVPTHYRIRVEGAEPPERWVSIDCGAFKEAAGAAAATGAAGQAAASGATEAVLSLAWEPSFCETHSRKPECAGEGADAFDATHLTLHGLWPQTREYCDVSRKLEDADKKGDWASLPKVDLSAATRQRLAKDMPGTQSLLERHEWIKHGTCYAGLDSEAYFGKALALADEVNASAVQALFAGKVGQTVTSKEIRAAFDSAFGAGTGDRVSISCINDGSRRLIAEIRIGLAGPDGKLATMTKAARSADADCQSGVVDAVATE